jgi:hypothetical protein
MLKDLIDTLTAVGKIPELYKSSDGSTVLVLPYGGRILGLFAPSRDQNFLWTHPALGSLESARAFYESGVWHNSGGDRTWLAPEVDLFFPNFPELTTYFQQRELDPGNYAVVERDNHIVLSNRLAVLLSRSKLKVKLEITKSVGSALNPLRYEPSLRELIDIDYAGYTLHTSLEFVGSSRHDPPKVGLWNLLQMPHGGDLLVATYARDESKIYMGTIGAEDLIVSDHLIRYKMRAAGEHKIGFRAVNTTGRVGYLCSSADQSALVVRNFSMNPSGEYIDTPWCETGNLGYSTQACNVNGALGSFSELEYHVPAIGQGTSQLRSDDVSQVWAFRGSRAHIQTVARCLLSSEI